MCPAPGPKAYQLAFASLMARNDWNDHITQASVKPLDCDDAEVVRGAYFGCEHVRINSLHFVIFALCDHLLCQIMYGIGKFREVFCPRHSASIADRPSGSAGEEVSSQSERPSCL